MAKQENLKERMDTIKANSVTDREFEDTWGVGIDAQVEKMMERWDTLLDQTREAIENDQQPADERQQPAAEEQAESAERKEVKYVYYIAMCPQKKSVSHTKKAEKAAMMHELCEKLNELFNEYLIKLQQKECENENDESTKLVVLDLSEITTQEEKQQIIIRLDKADFEGVKLKRLDVRPEGDYDLLELIVQPKIKLMR